MEYHTQDCQANAEKQALVRAEISGKYKQRCGGCDGTGGNPDDPCSWCITHGCCPLCFNYIFRFPADKDGEQFNAWLESKDPCPHCGERFENVHIPDVECIC